MAAYEIESWHELFVMAGGAAAALAGLIFVAVSLNLEHVLTYERLPALAGQTVAVLIAIVVLSALVLAPGESVPVLGVEVLALALVLAAFVLVPVVRGLPGYERTVWKLSSVGLALLVVLPMVGAGVTLVVGAGGGMYWALAEVVAGVAVASYNAWILLVEIRR